MDVADQILADYAYTLDPTGRRTQVQEAHNGRTTSYSYDELYRLTGETITDPVNGNHSAEYQFDKLGNRTYSIINGVHTAYSYDNNDRLTQQGGVSYRYDANGNTLTETDDGQVTSYHYDARNKLIEVGKPGLTASYGYNADGIRTQKTENGITTNYVVDSNRDYAQVLAEVTNGTAEVNYTYGDDLVFQTRAGTPSYYLYDGHGSTRALANASGSLTDSYDYDAFGVLLNSAGDTENTYRYTGEQLDPKLNQYYLRARYYHQGVGRFTQQDTWMGNSQDPITLNKYLYANADPATYTDPTGNFGLAITAGRNLSISASLASRTINVAGVSLIASLSVLTGDQDVNENRERTAVDVSLGKFSARRCAMSGSSECNSTIPIIFFGADLLAQTKHIADAQRMGIGLPALSRRNPAHGRGWWNKGSLKGRTPCGPGRTGAGTGKDCDEFPFASTEQGGSKNYRARQVSLRPINSTVNQAAGRSKLLPFYRECNVRASDPVKKWFGVVASTSIPKTDWNCAGK